MADNQVQIQIKLNFQFKDTDEIRKYFLSHERLKGYEIGVHTAYAERLEYGCGPYKDIPGEDYDELVKDLQDWARVKFNLNKEDAKAMGKSIADRFWEHGMHPHYFYRPAIAWMTANMQQLVNDGKSIGEICHMAENMIIDEIERQQLLYKGTMLQSVSCRPLDDRELLSNTTRKVSIEEMRRVQSEMGGKWK